MTIEIPDGLTAKERANFLSTEFSKLNPNSLEAQEILSLLNQAMMDIKAEAALEKGIVLE